MREEQWKDIPGYEGQYQASTEGRIRSLRVLKGHVTTGTGYLAVVLTGQERFAVHTLIARTFIGPAPLGFTVNHIDSERVNNRPDNLEYLTQQDNNCHAFRTGNRKLYFTDAQMDQIADWFFRDQRSATGIAKEFLPEKFSPQQFRGMMKKVRSVLEIWRASQRPPLMRNPYEHKLDLEKARKIRQLYAAGNVTQRELGKMFDVHMAHISRVVSGQLWSDGENQS